MNDTQRFLAKVKKSTKCWEWTASKDGFGYGMFSLYGKRQGAHRASWQIFKGQIPKKMYVLHKCDNPSCVRPGHLFIGTQKENVKDAVSKGRHKTNRGDVKRNKTHCPAGHPYKGKHLYIDPQGWRHCRTCAKRRRSISYWGG